MPEIVTTHPKDRPEATEPQPTRGGYYFSPRVDIFETDKELTLLAELPGVRSEDVELNYEKGELRLHGRVRPEQHDKKKVLAREYEEGDFYRAFNISESINAAGISAECKNGLLTVHLPKVEAARPRQISVKAN
jgi:HSP20 family protein